MRSPSQDRAPQDEPAVFNLVARSDGLPNRVKRQLLQEISEGRLAPGHRLPPERELATRLGVSRNVVREAIRSLIEMNILQARQGAGVFVTALDIESLLEPLQFVVSLESTTLRSLIEARLAIEPGIARLAALNGSPADHEALVGLLEQSSRRAAPDPKRFMQIDVQLHARIVRMANNPFLTRIMQSLGALVASSREFTNSVPAMRKRAHEDHERIVAALCANDAEAAEVAMRDHLMHVAQTLNESD
jgi:GntR family transcriptional regulator, transcriptional repressor for pyruvate dehydrogenase complex